MGTERELSELDRTLLSFFSKGRPIPSSQAEELQGTIKRLAEENEMLRRQTDELLTRLSMLRREIGLLKASLPGA